MSLQYITDDKGRTTGVFIPIQEWEKLQSKYKGIEQDTEDAGEVPEWQKEIVRERMKNARPEEYLSWAELRERLKLD
jgi:hypothetical protein